MKFIANSINRTYFQDILPNEEIEIDSVLAAIVYGSSIANEKEYCRCSAQMYK